MGSSYSCTLLERTTKHFVPSCNWLSVILTSHFGVETALSWFSSLSSVTDRAVFRLLVQKYLLAHVRRHLMFLLRFSGMWRPIVEGDIPTFRRITTQKICKFGTYHEQQEGPHRTTYRKRKLVHGSTLLLGFEHTIPRSTTHRLFRPLRCAASNMDSMKLKTYT